MNNDNNRNNLNHQYGNNSNINMYFPPNDQQNIPVNQPNQPYQQRYGYNTNTNQQTFNYPVPQVNPEEAHRDERAEFVLPESVKIIMIVTALICFFIFLVFLFIK